MSDDAYRFTTPRPWDQQPGLWVITTLTVLLSLLVFAGRLIIRRQFSAPEIMLSIAYILAAASWIALYVGLNRGAGIAADHTSMAEYSLAGKAVFAGNIILFAAQGAASCSQIVHLREIVPSTREKRLCLIGGAVCCIACGIAITCISAGCSSGNTMNTGARASCSHGVARWTVAALLVIVQTVLPAILPIHLFKALQTPSSQKRSILAAFSFPFVNVVTIVVMLWSYISSMNESPDGTGLVGVEICLQILLGWSLICPTVPCMRPLAMRFTTGGAIVLAGEASRAGTAPSTTKSFPDSKGFRKRRSHPPSICERQEQDEIELNPKESGRPASTVRTSDDDGQGSVESCGVSQGGIHVSRRYEVHTEEVKNEFGITNTVFPASPKAIAFN